MNQGKYIFSQLTKFLPRRALDRIVKEHGGNRYIRSFTCWNWMLCIVFGQLTARKGMRDLMLGLVAYRVPSQVLHLGFGTTVTRRNFGKANAKRDCSIFEEFAYVLIGEARKSCYRGDFEIDVEGNVYALDIAPYEAGSFYVMDKVSIDFSRLYAIDLKNVFFVLRSKSNTSFKRMYSRASDRTKGVR